MAKAKKIVKIKIGQASIGDLRLVLAMDKFAVDCGNCCPVCQKMVMEYDSRELSNCESFDDYIECEMSLVGRKLYATPSYYGRLPNLKGKKLDQFFADWKKKHPPFPVSGNLRFKIHPHEKCLTALEELRGNPLT